MIITEYYDTRPDGVKLYRTYSDANKKIRQEQTGVIYDKAVDIENRGYTYIETDEFIDNETLEKEASELLDILLGGAS